MYSVEMVSEYAYTEFNGKKIRSDCPVNYWIIREIDSKRIIGKYNNYKYAAQQAWYKYKCQLKKVERLLLIEDV